MERALYKNTLIPKLFWESKVNGAHAVPVVLLPRHEDDEEADHEARHGHGEGGERSERKILGQKVGQNSSDDG